MHRIGAVRYLNTKPLIEGLAENPQVKLSLKLPSQLAPLLLANGIDAGLIPIVDFLANPNLNIVPGISISCEGPVLSVEIFSRVPFSEIKTLDADVGSHTSIVLAQILLNELFGISPQITPLPMTRYASESVADAVLLIGDRALKAELHTYPYSWDLGWEWQKLTGLPMVFAVWAARPDFDLASLTRLLTEAKQLGIKRIPTLAHNSSRELQLDGPICRKYLEHIIRFDLGPREVKAINEFARLGQSLQLLPQRINKNHVKLVG